MRSPHSIDETREHAALYAVGALRGKEAREFESHLNRGCKVCAAEVEAFSRVADALAGAVPPQDTSAQLRARVLERIASEAQAAKPATIDKNGIYFAFSSRLPWVETAFKKIDSKVLYRDQRTGMVTRMVRMAPGTNYPRHRHAEVEESYLIEGDLTIPGVSMRPGDYCRAEAGSVHSDISTRGGCRFIAIASERNELLE